MLLSNIFTSIFLSDFLITLALGGMAFRFWQGFRRGVEKISQLFFYFSIFFTIGFLFITISDILYSALILILGLFSTVLGLACFGYLIFYFKLSPLPPRYGFLIVFILGIIILSLSIFFPFTSYLDPETGKSYLQPHTVIGVLYFLLVFITTLPLGIFFIQKGMALPPSLEKTKVYGFAVILFLGLILVLIYSLPILQSYHLPLVIGWTIIFLVINFLTQKPPSSPKKYTPYQPTAKIEW